MEVSHRLPLDEHIGERIIAGVVLRLLNLRSERFERFANAARPLVDVSNDCDGAHVADGSEAVARRSVSGLFDPPSAHWHLVTKKKTTI
jgi:hypothetical protein